MITLFDRSLWFAFLLVLIFVVLRALPPILQVCKAWHLELMAARNHRHSSPIHEHLSRIDTVLERLTQQLEHMKQQVEEGAESRFSSAHDAQTSESFLAEEAEREVSDEEDALPPVPKPTRGANRMQRWSKARLEDLAEELPRRRNGKQAQTRRS